MDILIYALIAFVIVHRLYSVFGQRNQGEPQRRNPFVADDKNDTRGDNVLPLPTKLMQATGQLQGQQPALDPGAPAPESLAGALFAIRKIDGQFDERTFIKGARLAFEMIVQAFAAGERATLRNLTAPAIYKTFDEAVVARELRGERTEMKILNVREADITAASLDGSIATITVQFISDQQKTTYDREGHVLPAEGMLQITDRWCFTRDLKSQNPNWVLSATR